MSRLITNTELRSAYAEYVASNLPPHTGSKRSAPSEFDRKTARCRPELDAYAEYARVAHRTPVAR